MNRFRDKRKVVSLTLVGVAYLLIVIPLIISNIQKQTAFRGHAQTSVPIAMTPSYYFGGLNVFVGYADTYRPNPDVPTPWNGSSNTNYIGTNDPQHIDAGAIRFENTSLQPVIIHSIVVTEPNHVPIKGATISQKPLNLWGSFTVAPQTSTIITETKSQNFDTTDLVIPGISCTQRANATNNPPHIVITLADGKTTTLIDSGHVLDAGGGDPGKCKLNESREWSAIGTIGGTSAHLSLAPLNSTYPIGNNASLQLTATLKDTSNTLPLSNVDVTFTIVSGPNIGKTGSATTNTAGNATFSYTSTQLGTDTIKATVKNISGGSFNSNTVSVNWVRPTPTLTPTPTSQPTTKLNMTVYLDGIGSRGDNTNPTASSLSNKNPKHTTINADISVYTITNSLLASGTGTLTYNTTAGNYTGDVPISAGFPTGFYIIKVKTHTHLRKQIDQIQTITAGKDNTITPVALVTGDINNDNVLNILDYNLLLNCYSDLTQAVDCPDVINKNDADLNDDGAVNQIDYNLFLRELATQPGQ